MQPFGKEITFCHHSNEIKLHKVQESAGSAVGDINIHQGEQAAIQGVTGQTKLIILTANAYYYINTRVHNNRVQQDEYLLLRAAANQAIDVVIFQ